MITDKAEAFVKAYEQLTQADIAALEHLINTKEAEVKSYNVAAHRTIDILKTLKSALCKRFKMERIVNDSAAQRTGRGVTRDKMITYLQAQDFPISATSLAKGIGVSAATVYHTIKCYKECFTKLEDGYVVSDKYKRNGHVSFTDGEHERI